MDEERRKFFRRADVNDFLNNVRDASNEEAFEEDNTPDDNEDSMDATVLNDQMETSRIRHSTRKPKPTERMTKGKQQGKTIDKQEKEEKNRCKLVKSDFASVFNPPDCQDFSFLLNAELSPSQRKCQQELYSHFGIKKDTSSRLYYSHQP